MGGGSSGSESEEYIQVLKDKIEEQRLEIIALKMVAEKYNELLKGIPGLDDK